MPATKVTATARNAVFLAALAVSTLLVVANFVILHERARSQQSVAAVVNVSGRQRMLSQRTALLAQNLVLSKNPAERADLREELAQAIALFDRSHRGLTQGDPAMGLPRDLPPAASAIYFDAPAVLDKKVQQYSTELKSLVGTPDAELTPASPCAQNIHATAASGKLLNGLNAVVTAYQKDSEAKVAQLELLIWWVSGSTLVAVAVTFWLAFQCVRGEVRLRASLETRVQERTRSWALANAELQRSNSELEKFAYVVSHDLKAPLRAISSLAGWIAEDYTEVLDDEGRENLGLIVSRVQRMDDLIDGILCYSRAGRQKGRPEAVDSDRLARDVIELLAPPDNTTVRIEGTLPEVVYDCTQLGQVLQNLIDNGIKHMDKPEGEVVVSCHDDSRFWEFRVRDNGPGIPKEHFDRIFELFQTLKPRDELEAAGVGLAVAKRIVERHGGSIHVEPIVGEGIQFKFTVPKDCDQTKRSTSSAETDDARQEKTDSAG